MIQLFRWAILILFISLNCKAQRSATATSNCVLATQIVQHVPVYEYVDSMPEFISGKFNLPEYLLTNFRMPEQEEVQLRVTARFIVEKDGSISNVEVVTKGAGGRLVKKGELSLMDREMIRVIQKMPRWRPGKCHGETARVVFVLPMVI